MLASYQLPNRSVYKFWRIMIVNALGKLVSYPFFFIIIIAFKDATLGFKNIDVLFFA